jgi:hypothetical protein
VTELKIGAVGQKSYLIGEKVKMGDTREAQVEDHRLLTVGRWEDRDLTN